MSIADSFLLYDTRRQVRVFAQSEFSLLAASTYSAESFAEWNGELAVLCQREGLR
jgi:hypothetical protein